MKLDTNQALNVARGIVRERENEENDRNETIEETQKVVTELVEAGYGEDVILSTLSKLNVDVNVVSTGMVRAMIQDANQSEPLPPGESAPIGEGNPEPWKEWNAQEDAQQQEAEQVQHDQDQGGQENSETPATDDDSQ